MGIPDGIRVLDLTRNVAGPYCTMILGDLGAEVIKVERPGRGDDIRAWRPPEWDGYSTIFLAFNRNKQSLAVDLDTPTGQDIIRDLAQQSDVLVESFRPGSLAKRGLGYEQLREINPRLIYCSLSGFGSRGPLRDRPGYDPIVQAYSGIMSITGEAGRPPVRVGPAIVDMGSGMWSVIGILAALLERERTGQGRLVETSLLETGLAWMSYYMVGYLGSGQVPGRTGSRAPMIAPYEAFATRDEYLIVAAPNDALFARLCATIGTPELADDPRFRTNPERVAHRQELHELIEERLQADTAAAWEDAFLRQELPCSRVQALDQVAVDPQVEALGLLMSLDHLGIPGFRLVDLPVSTDGVRARRFEAPPEVGQHSDQILALLGYDQQQIEQLRAEGVIG